MCNVLQVLLLIVILAVAVLSNSVLELHNLQLLVSLHISSLLVSASYREPVYCVVRFLYVVCVIRVCIECHQWSRVLFVLCVFDCCIYAILLPFVWQICRYVSVFCNMRPLLLSLTSSVTKNKLGLGFTFGFGKSKKSWLIYRAVTLDDLLIALTVTSIYTL